MRLIPKSKIPDIGVKLKALIHRWEYVEYEGEKVFVINGTLDLSGGWVADLNDVEGLDKLKSLTKLFLNYKCWSYPSLVVFTYSNKYTHIS